MKTSYKFLWIQAIVFLILAGACFAFPVQSAALFFDSVALITTISALAFWHKAFVHRKGNQILLALAASALAVLLWMHRLTGTQLIIILFGIYMLFNFACEAVQFVLDLKEKASNTWMHFLLAAGFLVLGLFAILYRTSNLKLIFSYFGWYLLIQALQCFLEIFFYQHPSSSRSFSLRRWISLPVYIVSFLPGMYLRWLLKQKSAAHPLEYDQKKNDKPVNLRVFIHSGLGGEHLIGHMTFAYDGVMYSYGNYDTASEKFFRTVGPGIFFTVPADLYVNNSCIYEQSVLFEYGLHLSPKQEEKLKEIIARTTDNIYPWQPPLEKAGASVENFKKWESDYASRLWYRTNAKFYKFKDGKWKTYWVLGDNCSLFAEDILSQIGCDIVHKNGIVSPGEYFEFFEDAWKDPKSNVVYKSWHTAQKPETLFDVKPVRQA